MSMASRRIGWGEFSSSANVGRLRGCAEVAFELRLQGDGLFDVLAGQPRIELDDRIDLQPSRPKRGKRLGRNPGIDNVWFSRQLARNDSKGGPGFEQVGADDPPAALPHLDEVDSISMGQHLSQSPAKWDEDLASTPKTRLPLGSTHTFTLWERSLSPNSSTVPSARRILGIEVFGSFRSGLSRRSQSISLSAKRSE
jgi:hypothetical protein